MLYVSFDNRQGYDTKPRHWQRKRRKTAVSGKMGHFPVADYAAGNPIPLNVMLVESTKDGRYGGAVRIPKWQGTLGFDTDGNLYTRRGTIAFWARPDQPLWSSYYRGGRHPSVLSIRDRQNPLRIAHFMRIGVHSRHKGLYLSQVDAVRSGLGVEWAHQLEGGSRLFWRTRDQWPVATWGHMAVVWDAARGRKWYYNGRRVGSNWGKSPEHRPPFLNAIGLSSDVTANMHYGQAIGFSYDELYTFDYCLTDAQIVRLVKENKAPASRREGVPADPEADRRWVRAHYSWGDPTIPLCPPGGLTLHHAPVARCLEETTPTRRPMDGRTNTVWPLEYKCPPAPAGGVRVLTLGMTPDRPFDFVRLRGSFRGPVLVAGKPLGRFEGKAFVQRLRLSESSRVATLALRREDGRINQMQLFRLDSAPVTRPVLRRVALAPSTEAAPAAFDMTDARCAMRGLFLPDERATLAEVPAATRGTLRVPAGKAFHILTAPADRDTELGGLELRLNHGKLARPCTLTLTVWEPLSYAREVVEFDVRLQPGGESAVLRLDGPAILLDKGRRLWITLHADQPLALTAGSRLTLYAGDKPQLRALMASLDRTLCDSFLQTSEPQTWNAMPGDDVVKQYKGVWDIVVPARQMLGYDPSDATAASILSWIAQFRRFWGPELRKRFKDPYANLKIEDVKGEGPKWAKTLRAAYIELRTCVAYWVGRQTPEGLLGSGPNDDTDLIPDVVNFSLIHDPDGRMRESIRRLQDYCWKNMLVGGVCKRMTDHLHAFEDGTNILPPLALLYYGDPEYLEQMMITQHTVENHVTGVNRDGDRLFRSHYFSATRVREDVAFDSGACLMLSPGRYLSWYNGNPRAIKVLRDWQRSFYRRMDKKYGPYLWGKRGMLSIDYKTGKPRRGAGGRGGMIAHLYWLFDVTGDKSMSEPVLAFWRRGKSAHLFPMHAWATWRDIMDDPAMDKVFRSRGKKLVAEAPELARKLGVGSRAAVVERLKGTLLYVRKFRPLLTWVNQSADRVRIPQNLMARLYLGGMADKAKRLSYHYHAVSWEGADQDVARWVLDGTRRRLNVILYNFHKTPQDALMRVWKLQHGRYRVRAGVDTNDDGRPDLGVTERTMELARYSPVALRLPPGKTLAVEVDLVQPLPSIRRRADLALGPTDTRWVKGKLRVVVHNVGGAPACGGVVEVLRGKQVVARKPFPPLEAPDDLKPRKAAVTFDGLRPAKDLRVRLVPERPIEEITLVNNELAPVPAR